MDKIYCEKQKQQSEASKAKQSKARQHVSKKANKKQN